jgi:hypothetical protein
LSEPPHSAASSGRITVQLDDELAERVRDTVMWLNSVGAQATIPAIAAASLLTELARLAAAHRDWRRYPLPHADPPAQWPPK